MKEGETRMEIVQHITQHKLVAIIRGVAPDQIMDVTKALYEGGIRTLEVTTNTTGVFESIEKIRNEYGDEIVVGAGTVLDAETTRMAITAGAQFIVSPTVDLDTITLTKRYGLVSIPGAMTPTEVLKAYETGGDIIKVFPATTLGPRYLKDIKGPLPHIPLMPTGGVNEENIKDYFDAGAVAAGLGGTFVKSSENDLQSVTDKAKQLIEKIRME